MISVCFESIYWYLVVLKVCLRFLQTNGIELDHELTFLLHIFMIHTSGIGIDITCEKNQLSIILYYVSQILLDLFVGY